MKLIVVTVNYGVADLVLRSLESLVPQLRALGSAAVWIVDNHSPDASVATLRRGIEARGFGDCVRLITSPVNDGFGAGNNIAFREAMASADPPDYFYLLNPDAAANQGCVAALVSFLDQHPRAGVAGGMVVDSNGAPQASAFRFPSPLSEIESWLRLGVVTRLLREHTVGMVPPSHDTRVDWVSGASFMIRRSVLEQVGLFDEEFFLYFEEVDLCRRVRDAGHEIWFVHAAVVTHEAGATTGVHRRDSRLPGYWFASRAHYFRKSHGARGLVAMNVLAATCLTMHRVRQVAAWRDREQPHQLRDLLSYSFGAKRTRGRRG